MQTLSLNTTEANTRGQVRIAHCIHGLGLGGAQQIIKYLVSGADKGKYKHFVYSGKDGVFRREIEEAGAVVRTMRRWIPKLDPVWALRLARTMRLDGIDIVHTHLFGDSLHGYLAAKTGAGLPVIMTVHNSKQDFSRIQLCAYRYLLPNSTRVVACAPSARDSFVDLLGDKAGCMRTIPNGFDAAAITTPNGQEIAALKNELGIPPQARVIGAIGRMVEQKGFKYLISAFSALSARSDDTLRLVMLGSGSDLESLRRQARAEGVGESVLFLGFRSDARDIIATFDVLAFSSLYEGLPVALLEAMAAGASIVATAVTGLAEVLEHERSALLVPARDPDALAAGLGRALADQGLRTRLGEAARNLYLGQYTSSRMVERYEALYREILDEEEAPSTAASAVRAAAQGSR